MMSTYLEIKNSVMDGETDLVEEEEEEDDDGREADDDVDRERDVEVQSVESHLKKRKSSLGEEGSGRRSGANIPAGGDGGGPVVAQPCCMVESCRADLRGCKRYHRRHRVREVHAKAPVVLVDGFGQRFCQQCNSFRFHELSEFDQTKRSRRLRLAGHNERRRRSSLDNQKNGSSRRLKENQRRHLN